MKQKSTNFIAKFACKSEICGEIVKNAPSMLDYVCDECREHFEQFKKCLDSMNITYNIDSGIVRGLDYYTKNVFEIISGEFTVCGGGRYDGLVEELGGKQMPAVGFGLGIERLLLRLSENGVEIPMPEPVKLYIIPLGDNAGLMSQKLVFELRKQGISVETEHRGRGLRASMKYADKIGAQYTLVLGDNEIQEGTAALKNMLTGESTDVNLDNLYEYLK